MQNFWQTKTLQEMTDQEWEALCDGCGRCCLLKLEDDQTGELFFTQVSCSLLDISTCRCTDYPNRKQRIPECLQIKHMSSEEFSWLPPTCAYRLLANGEPLPDWHPLISGQKSSVNAAGISVDGFAVSEDYIHPDQLEAHIIKL